jgi:hypothetical protein
LLGQTPRLSTVLPRPAALVDQLVTVASGGARVFWLENDRYILHPDGSWEYRCPIKLFASLAQLKLDGFRQHWKAQLVCDDGKTFVFRIPTGETLRRRFWRQAPVQSPVLEMQIRLAATAQTALQLCEAIACVRVSSGEQHTASATLREWTPRLCQSMRAHLQGTPEQRLEERWPFTPSLRIFPVLSDLQLAGGLDAQGIDISRGGIRLQVRAPLPWPRGRSWPESTA